MSWRKKKWGRRNGNGRERVFENEAKWKMKSRFIFVFEFGH